MTDPPSLEQRVEWTRGFRCATDKAVLKALAKWFAYRSDGTNVQPVIAKLAAKSGVPKRSVERAMKRLEDGEWIRVTARRHRLPTTYRIGLDRLATADPDQVKVVVDNTRRAPPSDRQSGGQMGRLSARVADKNNFDRHSGGQETSGGQEIRPEFEKVADKVAVNCTYVRTSSREEEEGGEVPSSSTTSSELVRQSGGQNTVADNITRFLAWWTDTYPQQNAGALSRRLPTDAAIVEELLADGFTVDQLQAMSVALWSLVEGDDQPTSDRTWTARSDRSLRVLRHKAHYLARVVAGRSVDAVAEASQQDLFGPLDATPLTRHELEEAKDALRRVYVRCPHEPQHEDWRVCVREIAYARRA